MFEFKGHLMTRFYIILYKGKTEIFSFFRVQHLYILIKASFSKILIFKIFKAIITILDSFSWTFKKCNGLEGLNSSYVIISILFNHVKFVRLENLIENPCN